MNEKLVNVLRHLAIGSCIVCIIYMLYLLVLFSVYLASGTRVSAFPMVAELAAGVVSVTCIINILYIIAKRR